MYHGNVANMIRIFYSSLNEEGGKPFTDELDKRQAQSGQREADERKKTLKRKNFLVFLFEPLCITETLRI